MRRHYLGAIVVLLFPFFISCGAFALQITVAEVFASIDNQSLGIKDILPQIGNNQPYDFDLHTFFPVFSVGEATGFVSESEGIGFASLEKGLKLEVSALDFTPGTQVNISLFVQGTWLNPCALAIGRFRPWPGA
jgi:hypothetical protein